MRFQSMHSLFNSIRSRAGNSHASGVERVIYSLKHLFAVVCLLGFVYFLFALSASAQTPALRHYLYAVDKDGPSIFYIYDMDNGFSLVKQVNIATTYSGIDVRGLVVGFDGMLYISHGSYYAPGSFGKGAFLAKYDPVTGQVVWEKDYWSAFSIDSHSITPDGKKIYMATGEASGNSVWEIIDSSTGNVIGSIDSGQVGAHNTIVSNNGAHVYLGSVHGSYLVVADTSTNTITQKIGPTLTSSVRPFTINSTETMAFITETSMLGFEVGDIATGKILYTVQVGGSFAAACAAQSGQPCSHGISLSPDNKEIYVTDIYNNYVHVYNVSGLPATAPVSVADIPLAHKFATTGWLKHSRDGKYVFVGGSGDVIDTATHQITTFIPALQQTEKFQEVDFQNGDYLTGTVYYTSLSRSGVGYGAPTTNVSLSSSSLSFGNQTVGTTSSGQSTTLTNNGTSALAISRIAVTGTDSGDFAETNTCGSSLAAGGNCTISVKFTPTAAGTRTAAVTITDSDTSSPQAVSLSGTGVSTVPVAGVAPASLTFNSQTVGTTSAAQGVTLTNTGNAALTITGIAASGDFAETNNCGSTLAASANCTINVTFTPTATGTRTGSVSITDNATGSPQAVSLTGTGTSAAAPGASVAPTSLTFNSQTVGTTSTAQSVTLTNTGNAALTITGIAASGDFAETNNCGSSLAASAKCTINVTFTPTATGTRTGSVSVTDNATGSPQTVSLTGTGVSVSGTVNHYVYVFVPGSMYVYDMDAGFSVVKTVSIPQTSSFAPTGIRGVVASAATGMLYLSYGSYTCTGGQMLKYDLVHDAVVWAQTYSFGIDSMSISPDGQKIYMPIGESCLTLGTWEVIDANTGNPLGQINSGGLGPHNTITSLNGAHIYMGPRRSNYLVLADASTLSVIRNIGPVSNNVRPFTINGQETYAFITTSNDVGFNVSDIKSGNNLYWVCPPGFCWTSGSFNTISGVAHGISLSPNEKEIYLIDLPYNHVHVFDVTGLPGTAPVDVADIPLNCKLTVEGWLQHSRDGRFVFVGDCGDVIDTSTRKIVANMSQMSNSRIWNEVDFQNGVPSFSPLSRNQGGYVTQATSVSLSSSSLSFGNQTVGTTSSGQSTTLTNNGTSALAISSIAVTGTDRGDFAETNTCGSSLAAGGNCTISVTFTPTAAGTRTAAVTITDSDASSPQTASLTGTGVSAAAPGASVAPTSLTFNSQTVGTTSTAQAVTLTNTGNATLTITGITASGDFGETNNCGSTLAASAKCTINVTFTPTATGTRTGTLSITDNATGSPQAVSLTGTGVSTVPVAGVAPASLTFNSQTVGTTSTAQAVTLTNTGNAALTITGITVSGDFAETNTCGSSLAAGGNCTISVTFTPTTTGTRTGSLSITDNATGSPQAVSLTGTGTSAVAPGASIAPTSLTFNSQTVGTTSAAQAVTLTNTGNAALTITGIAASGDFAETNNCGSTLAASAKCTINVTFTPTATGTRTGSLSVTDNATGSPQAVSLTGMGVSAAAPAASVTPTSLTFNSQTVGTTSTVQAVTLTNTGNATLTITGISASGDFAETNNCGGTLAASAKCTINVTFTPTATGTRTGTLSITDNATGSPQAVSLTGVGVSAAAPAASVTPTSLTFASQTVGTTSAAQAVTLTNTGNATLTITSISPSGDYAETNNCGSSLAAGGNCTINVTFTPTTTGARTGSLSITDNATGSPQLVSLTGTGSAANSGNFSIATSTGSVSTTAGQPASFTASVTPTGGFNQTVSVTCQGAPQAANCTVSPGTLTPSGAGAMTATVMVTTTAHSMQVPGARPRWIVPPTVKQGIDLLRALTLLVLLIVISLLSKRKRQVRWAVGMVVLLVALVSEGCAGFVTSSQNGGTPPGTYTLTVKATSGSGTSAITHSATVTLTVN